MDLEALKYPAGKYQKPEFISKQHIADGIQSIALFPEKVKSVIQELNERALQYKYREGGWSIQQVVCHCVDSHMNSVIRFKLALTENNPVIRPYFEEKWAELQDTVSYDINEAIILLESIHKRWVFLLNELSEEDLEKKFIHPSNNEEVSLAENILIYAWHCNNHFGHILNAKKYQFS